MKKTKSNLTPKPNLLQKIRSRSSNHFRSPTHFLFFLFGFFLPTQLGKHFFESFSYISGVRVDYLAPTLYLTDLLVLLLVFTHKRIYKKTIKNVFVQTVFFLLAINLITSIGLPISLYRFFKIVEYIAVAGLFLYINARMLRRFIYGLGIGVFTQLTLVITQLISHSSQQGVWYYLGERIYNGSMPGIAKASLMGFEVVRPYGTFSHPNSLAGFFVIVATFFMFFRMPIMPLWLKRSLLLTSSVLVVLSLSIPAIVGLFGIYSYLIVHKVRRTKSLRDTLPYAVVTLLAIFVFGISALLTTKTALSVSQRVHMQLTALQIVRAYPLTGVGLGSYLYASSKYPNVTPLFLNQPVHNVFLLVTAELGMIISVILCYLVWRMRKHISLHLLSGALIWIVVITGLFDHYWVTLQQNALLLYVIGGLSLRADLDRYDSACEVGLPDRMYRDQTKVLRT